MQLNLYANCHSFMGLAESAEEDRRMYMVKTLTPIDRFIPQFRLSQVRLYAEDRDWQPNATLESDEEEHGTCGGDTRRTRTASETFLRRETRLAALVEMLKLESPVDALEVDPYFTLADEYSFTCCELAEEKRSSKPFFLKPSVATWYHPPRSASLDVQAIRPLEEVAPPGAQAESAFHLLPSVGTWFAKPRPPRLIHCLVTGGLESPSLLVQVRSPRSALTAKGAKPRSTSPKFATASEILHTRSASPKSALSSGARKCLILPIQSKRSTDDDMVPTATSGQRMLSFDKSVDTDSPKRSKMLSRTPSTATASPSHLDKVDGLSPHRFQSPKSRKGSVDEVERPKVVGTGNALFRVSVPNPYPGVQYRKSMNLEDRWPRFAQNDLLVRGTVKEGAMWLKLEKDVYLPMQVGSVKILRPVNEEGIDEEDSSHRVARMPTHAHKPDAEIPWWMIWCSVCNSSASSETEVVMEARAAEVVMAGSREVQV